MYRRVNGCRGGVLASVSRCVDAAGVFGAIEGLTLDCSSATCEGWMVLVMDDVATRTISSVLGMYDIMEAKVTLVEQLSRPRQPFREMEVIYLITPTEESINYVLNDFQSDSKATYGDVHLFFLSPVRMQSA